MALRDLPVEEIVRMETRLMKVIENLGKIRQIASLANVDSVPLEFKTVLDYLAVIEESCDKAANAVIGGIMARRDAKSGVSKRVHANSKK